MPSVLSFPPYAYFYTSLFGWHGDSLTHSHCQNLTRMNEWHPGTDWYADTITSRTNQYPWTEWTWSHWNAERKHKLSHEIPTYATNVETNVCAAERKQTHEISNERMNVWSWNKCAEWNHSNSLMNFMIIQRTLPGRPIYTNTVIERMIGWMKNPIHEPDTRE